MSGQDLHEWTKTPSDRALGSGWWALQGVLGGRGCRGAGVCEDWTRTGEVGVNAGPALPRKWLCLGLEQVRNGVTLSPVTLSLA